MRELTEKKNAIGRTEFFERARGVRSRRRESINSAAYESCGGKMLTIEDLWRQEPYSVACVLAPASSRHR